METILELPRNQDTRAAQASAPPTASRVAVASLFFINGALLGTWVARIPAIHASLGLSDGVFGLALLAMALGALLAMPLASWCSHRFSSQRVCRALVLVYAGLLPSLAFAPNIVLFVLALFCFGVSHGGLDVSMNAQAVLVEQRYGRPIMSSLHALFSVGGLAGSLAGGLFAARGVAPWIHFGASAALLGGASLLTFPFLVDEHRSAGGAPSAAQGEPGFALPSGALAALGAVAFCSMMGEGAMADWSAIFLRSVLHANEGFAAGGYAAFSVTMAATRFFGDRISARLGAVNTIRLGGTAALAGLGIVLLNPYPSVSLLGFAGVGAGLATVVPLVFSAAGRAPGMSPGLALSSVTTLGYLGFLVGPPIIGFASEWVGLRGALTLLVATSALIIGLASRVDPRAAAAA